MLKFDVTEVGGRQYVSTGNAWEQRYGYSRAVRVGDRVWLTGTLGVEEDGTFAPDAAGQANRAFDILLGALQAVGGTAADLVYVRGYLTDIQDADAIGAVFKRRVVDAAGVRPGFLQVEVSKLAAAEAKVELEAEAVISR